LKKICFVLTAEFAVKAFLLNHLRQLTRFYDVTVITNTNNPNFLEEAKIKANVISLGIARDISFISDLSCLFALTRIFYQNRYDAVHSVTPKAGLLAMISAWLVRVPMRTHTFTGQVWASKKGVKRFFLKIADRFFAMFATHIIVDSPSQLEFLINEKVIPRNKAIVFGKGSISGVDTNRFKPSGLSRAAVREELGISNDGIVFLFLGRLNIDKGVLDLATAFNSLNQKNAYLLFVGPDEQKLESNILQLTVGCPGKVFFVGMTNQPEAFMTAADVLCLPSYREGFGSVIVEAASTGIPAIASEIYGITDAVVDNVTGLLHPPKDISAIGRCLERLCVDDALRVKLGQQARVRAINDFSSTLITAAWVDFYKLNLQ
jgi:glycosyltransferase involved in cell wall biosynthesis